MTAPTTTPAEELLGALVVGDYVRVDRDALRLSPADYGLAPYAKVTAIGARGAITAELTGGRTVAVTASTVANPARQLEQLDALRYAQRPAGPVAEDLDAPVAPARPRPVVVVPCGAAKLDHAAPAGELYTGSVHRSARLAAARLAADLDAEVLILSALHGLTDLDTIVEPYDVTVGDAGAIGPIELAAQVAERGLYGRRVVSLAGKRYSELLEAAGIHQLERPLDGVAGLGPMRGRLAAIARTGLLDAEARLEALGPAGRHAEQLELTFA